MAGETVESAVKAGEHLVVDGRGRGRARRRRRVRGEVEAREVVAAEADVAFAAAGAATEVEVAEGFEAVEAVVDDGLGRGLGAAACARQGDEGADLLNEVAVGEGFDEVVLGARLQLLVLRERLGGRFFRRDDQRDAAEIVVFLELVADRVAAHLRQLDAEHDEVGPALGGPVEAVFAVVHLLDLEAARAQGASGLVGKRLLGVDEEDSAHLDLVSPSAPADVTSFTKASATLAVPRRRRQRSLSGGRFVALRRRQRRAEWRSQPSTIGVPVDEQARAQASSVRCRAARACCNRASTSRAVVDRMQRSTRSRASS